MPGRIDASDLTPEQRKQFGIKNPKQQDFSKEEVRHHAIGILFSVADLKQSERKRILTQALKLNEV